MVHKEGWAGSKRRPCYQELSPPHLSLCAGSASAVATMKKYLQKSHSDNAKLLPSGNFQIAHFYYKGSLEGAGGTQTGLSWDNVGLDYTRPPTALCRPPKVSNNLWCFFVALKKKKKKFKLTMEYSENT